MRVSDQFKKDFQTGYYASGHMVFIDLAVAAKYHADLEKFVKSSLPK